MSLYLHRNLAGLAGLASRDARHFALATVRVRDPGSGLYRVEATDGKALTIVQGAVPDESYPSVEQAGEGVPEVLVPRDAWLQAFKLGGKSRPVGIAASKDAITLAVGDQSIQVPVGAGRYPDVDAVLPKSAPLLAVRVNPELLVALLKLAAAINPEQGVTLLLYGKDRPLGLMTGNEQGQTLDALLMPLS